MPDLVFVFFFWAPLLPHWYPTVVAALVRTSGVLPQPAAAAITSPRLLVFVCTLAPIYLTIRSLAALIQCDSACRRCAVGFECHRAFASGRRREAMLFIGWHVSPSSTASLLYPMFRYSRHVALLTIASCAQQRVLFVVGAGAGAPNPGSGQTTSHVASTSAAASDGGSIQALVQAQAATQGIIQQDSRCGSRTSGVHRCNAKVKPENSQHAPENSRRAPLNMLAGQVLLLRNCNLHLHTCSASATLSYFCIDTRGPAHVCSGVLLIQLASHGKIEFLSKGHRVVCYYKCTAL